MRRKCGHEPYDRKDSEAMGRERARGAVDAKETLDESPEVRQRRSRADDLHLASLSDEEVARERAKWRGQRMMAGGTLRILRRRGVRT